MKINFENAAELLKNCSDVYILIHQNPDGDCVGAGTALYHVLKAMGKRSKILCSDDIPKRYSFMMDNYVEEDFKPKFFVATDVADANLLGKYKDVYGDKVDLCIDHHISNTDYAQNTLVCPFDSSACEVVYELMKILGVPVTDVIAKCIYTGIATDTGCFKYDSATARCFEIVSELKRNFHIDYAEINRRMFDIKSIGRLKIESAATDSMEHYLDGRCTMICITSDILNKWTVEESELDGCAGIPLQAKGAEIGVTIRQKGKDCYRISMRSATDVNVSNICASLGGGGHVKAAGCQLHGTLEDVKQKIIEAVKKGLEECP